MYVIVILFFVLYLILPNSELLFNLPKVFELFLYFFIYTWGAFMANGNYMDNPDFSKKYLIKSFLFFTLLYSSYNIFQYLFPYPLQYGIFNHLKIIAYPLIALSSYFFVRFILSGLFRNIKISIIPFIANITLEIYLVQFLIINYSKSFPFPWNVLIAVSLIVLFAFIINKLSSLLINNVQMITSKISKRKS